MYDPLFLDPAEYGWITPELQTYANNYYRNRQELQTFYNQDIKEYLPSQKIRYLLNHPIIQNIRQPNFQTLDPESWVSDVIRLQDQLFQTLPISDEAFQTLFELIEDDLAIDLPPTTINTILAKLTCYQQNPSPAFANKILRQLRCELICTSHKELPHGELVPSKSTIKFCKQPLCGSPICHSARTSKKRSRIGNFLSSIPQNRTPIQIILAPSKHSDLQLDADFLKEARSNLLAQPLLKEQLQISSIYITEFSFKQNQHHPHSHVLSSIPANLDLQTFSQNLQDSLPQNLKAIVSPLDDRSPIALPKYLTKETQSDLKELAHLSPATLDIPALAQLARTIDSTPKLLQTFNRLIKAIEKVTKPTVKKAKSYSQKLNYILLSGNWRYHKSVHHDLRTRIGKVGEVSNCQPGYKVRPGKGQFEDLGIERIEDDSKLGVARFGIGGPTGYKVRSGVAKLEGWRIGGSKVVACETSDQMTPDFLTKDVGTCRSSTCDPEHRASDQEPCASGSGLGMVSDRRLYDVFHEGTRQEPDLGRMGVPENGIQGRVDRQQAAGMPGEGAGHRPWLEEEGLG